MQIVGVAASCVQKLAEMKVADSCVAGVLRIKTCRGITLCISLAEQAWCDWKMPWWMLV
jgi:hypothetical protein